MTEIKPLVNAWIFLNEDEPQGTYYADPTSCYQTLIQNNVYQSVDILFIAFVSTLPTSSSTVPQGEGNSYTIWMEPVPHAGSVYTNQDYMAWVIRDARANNPNIKISVTLNWGDGTLLNAIFSNTNVTPQENAASFAANLVTYLQTYDLDGFDVDWESPISSTTTKDHFGLLFDAIGAAFRAQAPTKTYYLTLSPAVVGNLDADAVNANVAFINLQLYSGFTSPQDFTRARVDPSLFAYGASTEAEQTAQAIYHDNQQNYRYSVYTCWRLNSTDYAFEQQQQQLLYQLVFPSSR